MSIRPGRKKSKNPSYFSNEFIITNHGDIVSFVAMIIVMGLLYKGTHSFSSSFLFIQHNVTDEEHPNRQIMYSPGRSDFCVIFFYTLISIVVHAVLQEYVFDRCVKKLDLTRTRLGKFNESAHLACFYALSVFWAVYNVVNESLLPNLSSLWEGYPHSVMPFWTKLFLISQICYWAHDYPELYFQRVKKELIPARVLQSTIFLLGISFAYVGGLHKVCIVLLTIHYSTDFFLHVARSLHFTENTQIASVLFTIWNVIFIPVRMACIVLPFLVLHYGIGKESISTVDLSSSNINTPSIRFSTLLFLFITQAYMVWNFITFHQKFRRQTPHSKVGWFGSSLDAANNKRKEKKKLKRDDEDTSDNAVDSSDQRELRRRKPNKTRN